MPANNLSPGTADEMVEHLFADQNPSSFDRLLYPGVGDGVLVDAVHRYCERESMRDIPEEVALDVTIDDTLTDRHPSLEVHEADFLGDTLDLGLPFHYIISDPPTVAWETLSAEQRRAYASNSGLITVDGETDPLRSDLLFIEQSLRHLEDCGRAVFFTDPTYKTAPEADRFRQVLTDRMEDVVDVEPTDTPDLDTRHVITILDNAVAGESEAPFRYDPAEYEAMLNTRIATERPFTASAIMTADPESYPPTVSAAETFVDLIHKDYDAALVHDSVDQREGLRGFVSRETLRLIEEDDLGECVAEMTERDVIPPDTHISTVIDRLGEERFQFVGTLTSVAGIITRFDLNRLPVYLHLFDRLSEFEIGLRNLIRREAPEWEETADVYVSVESPDELIADRLTAAQLSNLIDIVEELGLERHIRTDIMGYERSLDDLRRLRNQVAHYNPIVHTMSDGETSDEDRRGAPQLAREYTFLTACIDGLQG